MKKKRNSAVVSLSSGIKGISSIAKKLSDDGVAVYAAQAAFYTIIASIPFLMMLISLIRYVAPDAVFTLFKAIRQILPERFSDLFTGIYEEITVGSDLSVISITALTSLWSSSRAMNAVTKGVAFIYDAEQNPGFIRNTIYSIVYTISFVILIIGALVVLVFGTTVRNVLTYRFPRLEVAFSLIMDLRGVVFFVVLTLFFSLVYYAVSKGILHTSGGIVKYTSQLPGAVFASAGWMLFSYFYSLYMKYYPTASYIYGSLAAVMLMMFWLYFCMIILLVGAEINKYFCK